MILRDSLAAGADAVFVVVAQSCVISFLGVGCSANSGTCIISESSGSGVSNLTCLGAGCGGGGGDLRVDSLVGLETVLAGSGCGCSSQVSIPGEGSLQVVLMGSVSCISLIVDSLLFLSQSCLVLISVVHLLRAVHNIIGSSCAVQIAVIDHLADDFLIESLAQVGLDGSIDLIIEHLLDLGLVLVIDGVVNDIIVLMLLRILSNHGVLVIVLIVDNAVTIGVLVGVHDVLHVKLDVLSQPVVDDHVLLNVSLSAGGLDQVQDLVTGALDSVAVQLDAEGIGEQEGGDHTGDVVIAQLTVADLVDGVAAQDQHFAQDAQAVFIVVVLQEERSLNTQDVGILFPVVQILLVHAQNGLDLLVSQIADRAVSHQDLDFLQFSFECDDGGIVFIDFGFVCVQQSRCDRSEVERNFFFLRLFSGCGDFFSSVNSRIHDCFCLILSLSCERGHGDHAQQHRESQQHTEEFLCVLLHCFASFHIIYSHWNTESQVSALKKSGTHTYCK